MFYEEIPDRDSKVDSEEVETYTNTDEGNANYYSDAGDMSNYSFSNPSTSRGPEKELLRYFLARGMRPQQALVSTRAVLSGKTLQKSASDNRLEAALKDVDPDTLREFKTKAGYGLAGAGLGAVSQLSGSLSPRRVAIGAALGGLAGAITPDNPGVGLGLAGASLGLLRSANVGHLLRHVKPTDKLKNLQRGIRDAASRDINVASTKGEIRSLNKAINETGLDRSSAAVKSTIDNFLRRVDDGFSADDVLTEAGNPQLTSIFSRAIPNFMGGLGGGTFLTGKGTRLAPKSKRTGIGRLFNSADDIHNSNISGLEEADIGRLRRLSRELDSLKGSAELVPGSNPLADKSLQAAAAIKKFTPEAAKEIVRASGEADRAAAHIMSPLLLGAAGSAVGEVGDSLFNAEGKAYGATSALRDTTSALTGPVAYTMLDSVGVPAAYRHFNDNYGKYLVGAAAAAPLLYHLYNTPMREDLRTRGRI